MSHQGASLLTATACMHVQLEAHRLIQARGIDAEIVCKLGALSGIEYQLAIAHGDSYISLNGWCSTDDGFVFDFALESSGALTRPDCGTVSQRVWPELQTTKKQSTHSETLHIAQFIQALCMGVSIQTSIVQVCPSFATDTENVLLGTGHPIRSTLARITYAAART